LFNAEKDENKREWRLGAKPCDGERKMSQKKKKQVKEKTVRLTSETRCAQTMVTVYLVPARGVVATRL
jgi:hypothetical protein